MAEYNYRVTDTSMMGFMQEALKADPALADEVGSIREEVEEIVRVAQSDGKTDPTQLRSYCTV